MTDEHKKSISQGQKARYERETAEKRAARIESHRQWRKANVKPQAKDYNDLDEYLKAIDDFRASLK